MQKIKLTHRGPQVIECIDLFDEARYGADKLFFRKRCMGEDAKNIYQEVEEQVTAALSSEYAPQGGNPLTQETSETEITVPTIALNRYHIPNKKFWNNVVPTDVKEPYKASAAVKFSIRVHFRDDFAYIDFGCPWYTVDGFGGTLTESSKTEDFINKFQLLHCHFISKEDALAILKQIFKSYSEAFTTPIIVPQIIEEEIMTTELIDEDGSVIAL